MPERWEHELGKLQTLEPPAGTRARIAEGPHGEGVPPTPGRGQRVAAAVVALSVFAAAGAFALSAFRGDEPTVAADAGTAVLTLAAGIHPEASLTFDGETAGTVVDSYCWNQPNGAQACADMVPPEPFRPGQFLKVPEGATVVLVNDDAADPVTLTLTPGDDPTLLGLATSFEELRGLAPGRYVLTVAATWDQSPQPIVFHFALEIVPGEAEPEALAAMLDAPTDGSVPSLELRYGGVEASIHAQGGQWPGGPNAWNDDLQSFPAELPLGTMVTFDGDVQEVSGNVRFGIDADAPTEPLGPRSNEDPGTYLPDVPGQYVIVVTATWPEATMEYTFVVTMRNPEDVTVTWPQPDRATPFVHALYRDHEVPMTGLPGSFEDNGIGYAGDPGDNALWVPEGTDLWVAGEAIAVDAGLIASDGTKIGFEPVGGPMPAAVLRDPQLGSYTLWIEVETQAGIATFLLLRLDVGKVPGSASPAPFPNALEATVDAPEDGSLPSVTLTYGQTEQDFPSCATVWNGEQMACRAVLPTFGPSVEPGSELVVRSDADAIEAGLTILDPDLRMTDELIPLDVADGAAPLPDEAGFYGLSLQGTWPMGSAGLYVVVTIGEPEVPEEPQLPEVQTGVVPDLVGLGAGDAMKLLDLAGFVGVTVVRPMLSVANGVVASSDPTAGTSLDQGSEVRLVVSGTVAFGEGVPSVLDCLDEDRMPFGHEGPVLMPEGETFIRSNTAGIRDTDLVFRGEDAPGGADANEGWWLVDRGGEVVGVVDYVTLEGVACRGSGIGGV